jgi:SAM-dependent methyltransferase
MPDPATGDSASGLANFFSPPYQVHNRARLAHLESLGLPLANRRVLELGSGPGDHTGFYVGRGCTVVAVDARQDCLDMLQRRYPDAQTVLCDLNDPAALSDLGVFDAIHCYGILYHLEEPIRLIRYMGEVCTGLAVVETCVRGDQSQSAGIVAEASEDFTQSSTGVGSRPTRAWVFEALGSCFPFVYQTQTQPNHPEFPVDWRDLSHATPLTRAVFVASKQPLDMPSLQARLGDVQHRLDAAEYIAVLEAFLAEDRATLEDRDKLCHHLHAAAADLRDQLEKSAQGLQRLTLEAAELRRQLGWKLPVE